MWYIQVAKDKKASGFHYERKTHLKNKICDIKNKTSPAADVLFFSKKTRTFFNKKVVTIYVFGQQTKLKIES